MKVLVVFCHPQRDDSYTGAVLDRCLAGLRAGQHEHRVVDLYDGDDGADHVGWCSAVVFVYPTWWSGQPALLTEWLQRVAEPGAFARVRRIVAITSHGSSKLTNLVEGESGKHVLTRALRLRSHLLATTRWVALYDIDTCSADARERFLERVEQTMRRRRL